MRSSLWILLLALSAPAMAGITLDSNGIRINTNDEQQVNKWKEKHRSDCSSVKIGDVVVKSDGCSTATGKSKENRSVHGDNNPGKGHDKYKSGKNKEYNEYKDKKEKREK